MTKEKMGKGVRFERIRRITGYLVGTLDKCERFKKYKAIREVENEARRKYNFESAIFSKIT